ncbi:unnamed protein product [Dibothriocephalus latus]|uniref:Uncharacterized protein n=1 Tax=Dibothriocephalus latus TaxID=60516 RepID=A0A3P6QY80_DIBLA|nr:unnamed protein product [Dibothriocephalus latus]
MTLRIGIKLADLREYCLLRYHGIRQVTHGGSGGVGVGGGGGFRGGGGGGVGGGSGSGSFGCGGVGGCGDAFGDGGWVVARLQGQQNTSWYSRLPNS